MVCDNVIYRYRIVRSFPVVRAVGERLERVASCYAVLTGIGGRAFNFFHKHVAHIVVDEKFALQIAKVVGLHATFSERFSAISVGRHREPILWAVEHQTGYFLY